MRSISDKTQGPPFRLNSKHIVYHGEKFPFNALLSSQLIVSKQRVFVARRKLDGQIQERQRMRDT